MKFKVQHLFLLFISLVGFFTGLWFLIQQSVVETVVVVHAVGPDFDEISLDYPWGTPPPSTAEPAYTPLTKLSNEELEEFREKFKINVNEGSAEELMKLKGVGPATAADIIEYRRTKGPFRSIRDLAKVKGIGAKTLAKFADDITVGHPEDITFPQPDERKKSSRSTASGSVSVTEKININTAGSAELQKLPRVGPKTAEKIIQYREENGPFLRKEDIKKIKGIGPKTFENMKEIIEVD